MKLDEKVKNLITKAESKLITSFAKALEGSDFGIYIPVYADGDTIKPMLEGYSQTEKNLVVSISKGAKKDPEAKPVAWMGGAQGKDSKCTHGGKRSCTHCTGPHGGACKHCTEHNTGGLGGDLKAPELDYDSAIKTLTNKKDLLDKLALEGFGLTLLHGHNNKFMFTKLPEGYISVISNDVTDFRTEGEVQKDTTFVPNVWRYVGGKLKVAGGYSSI